MADDTPTAYYIATVWWGLDEWGDAVARQVVRLPACGPDDYRARVRALWPAKVLTFGPVSRSKAQG